VFNVTNDDARALATYEGAIEAVVRSIELVKK
jgi:hypothetical protein